MTFYFTSSKVIENMQAETEVNNGGGGSEADESDNAS